MTIEWNRVTWYSKAVAVVVFLVVFAVAFGLGAKWQEERSGGDAVEGEQSGVGLGGHCGGFIKDALVCAAGLHCQLKVSNPDVGGTCVAD